MLSMVLAWFSWFDSRNISNGLGTKIGWSHSRVMIEVVCSQYHILLLFEGGILGLSDSFVLVMARRVAQADCLRVGICAGFEFRVELCHVVHKMHRYRLDNDVQSFLGRTGHSSANYSLRLISKGHVQYLLEIIGVISWRMVVLDSVLLNGRIEWVMTNGHLCIGSVKYSGLFCIDISVYRRSLEYQG
jgi:hypothetical protein